MIFSAIVNGQVSYYAPLLGTNKERMRSTQTLVNSGLYWIEGFFLMEIALHPFIVLIKN